MLRNIMHITTSSTPIDIVFWCPVLKEEISGKIVDVVFLYGTHVESHFDILLNLLAITTNNNIIPIGHILHINNENTENTILFLALVK